QASGACTGLKTGSKCGSWLACDSNLSVTDLFTDTPLSQASQLPQWFCGVYKVVFQAAQGDLRITSTKFIGLNPGS
ncbi:hypothetical protein Q6252_29225, partial [Klebsiella pneumoniae]|uniref:hypothetical protein n=1 Tax=Klebsiella pneumoniae TaxID=573 RepID=UPI0027311B21